MSSCREVVECEESSSLRFAPFLESQTDFASKMREWIDWRAVVEWIILEVFVGEFLEQS